MHRHRYGLRHLVAPVAAMVLWGFAVEAELPGARAWLLGAIAVCLLFAGGASVLTWAVNARLYNPPPAIAHRLLPAAAPIAGGLSWFTPDESALQLEVYAWNHLGDRRLADACDRLRRCLPSDVCPWSSVNALVNARITLGQYREALALPGQWSEEARAKGAALFPSEAALVEVNLVEAEYNLGLLEDAKHRLDACETQVLAADAVVRVGFHSQRAWIAALEGRSADAKRHLGDSDIRACPIPYLAEHYFTSAFIALSEGSFVAARAAAQMGLDVATRFSSRRNGLFLLGRIAKAAGDLSGALEHFSAATEFAYQGQGGDGLLAYADTLRELEQSQRADDVYQMVCDRDPESNACVQARAALAGRLEPR
jgi:tetratricopeptide (TPR) repeat protein